MTRAEFTVLREHLLFLQICTSLPLDEATERLNRERPPGTENNRWVLCEDDNCKPVPCADHPETHTHYVFNC